MRSDCELAWMICPGNVAGIEVQTRIRNLKLADIPIVSVNGRACVLTRLICVVAFFFIPRYQHAAGNRLGVSNEPSDACDVFNVNIDIT
jgi:hypothetical protein